MATGTIKNLITDRGFDFIVPVELSTVDKDLSFHPSDVQGTPSFEQLQSGQCVEYDLGRDDRCRTPTATNVRYIPQP